MHRSFATIVVAIVGAVALLGIQPPPASAAEGYSDSATTVYTLDPAKGVLRVTVTIKVKNTTPDTSQPYSCVKYSNDWFPVPYLDTCYETTSYYITTASAVVESEAKSIKAVSGGKPLEVSAGNGDAWYRSVTVRFPELFYGESRTIKLTYTVKGGAPRSDTATRTLRAYASFCAIANGTDASTVTVRIPKGYDVATTGRKLKVATAGKERVFTSGAIKNPATWSACFSGTNKAGYRTQKLATPDGQTIRLRSWPEDEAWATSVSADVQSSLPLLQRLTGTGMSATANLNVQESATGNEYAGFYNADTNTVTVGEDFGQPAIVEHELAHVWFNGGNLKETWLSEGFAEWAARAVSEEDPACVQPDAAPGSITLATWRYLEPRADAAERVAVATQYQAACHVMTSVATAAGEERMTQAVTALLQRRDPYAADPESKRAARLATWKDWLDAVDELALAPVGVPETMASDLLVAYGVTTDTGLLAQRAAARTAYRDLVATVDGWTVPAAVRTPLSTWSFGAAETAIESATLTWALTGETDQALPGVDARHGPAAEAWEGATTINDLEAAADLAARQLAAARDVADALALVDQPLDIVQQVGLFGMQVQSPDAAIPAVRAGDGDAVAGITAQIRASVAGLRATGQQRIAAGGAMLALLVTMLAVFTVRRARLASRRRAVARAAAFVAQSPAPVWTSPPITSPRTSWPVGSSDDAPTQVWDVPILSSGADPDLGSLVHKPGQAPEPWVPTASVAMDVPADVAAAPADDEPAMEPGPDR